MKMINRRMASLENSLLEKLLANVERRALNLVSKPRRGGRLPAGPTLFDSMESGAAIATEKHAPATRAAAVDGATRMKSVTPKAAEFVMPQTLQFFEDCLKYDLLSVAPIYCEELLEALRKWEVKTGSEDRLTDCLVGVRLRQWLQIRFSRDGVPAKQRTEFFKKLKIRQSSIRAGKNRPYMYLGIEFK